MHTAQKDEHSAAHMLVVIVIWQPRTQLAVHGQQVQHILQVVTVAEDGRLHGQLAVGLIVRAEPVGFIVGHVIAPVMFKG
ncbi:hypothetical protein D3C77_501910 [compost metagenome]